MPDQIRVPVTKFMGSSVAAIAEDATHIHLALVSPDTSFAGREIIIKPVPLSERSIQAALPQNNDVHTTQPSELEWISLGIYLVPKEEYHEYRRKKGTM